MANFHTNQLVIAANEEDMVKVLRRMAENLAANSKTTGFDLSRIAGIEGLRPLCRKLMSEIERHYTECLCGAPVGSEGYRVIPTDAPLGEKAKLVGVAVAPVGRPMSDTASIRMERCNKTLIFNMTYDTAWVANYDDVSSLLESLEEGDYGFSFFDADEGDDYQTINTCWGKTKGRGGKQAVGPGEYMNRRQIGSLARKASKVLRGELDDMAEVARISGFRNWSAESSYGSPPDGDLIYSGSGYFQWSWWERLEDEVGGDVEGAILDLLYRMPAPSRVKFDYDPALAENLKWAIAGDPVTLTSEWSTNNEYPVHISVDTLSGANLGVLRLYLTKDLFKNSSYTKLAALILPFLKARLESVEPPHKEDGQMQASAHLTLSVANFDLDAMLDDARAILREYKPELRSRTSAVEEVR